MARRELSSGGDGSHLSEGFSSMERMFLGEDVSGEEIQEDDRMFDPPVRDSIRGLPRRRSMRDLIESMEIERPDLREGKKADVIAALRKIVKEHQYAEIQGVMVDATTANVALQVYDALSPKNQRNMASLPIDKMVDLVWRLVGK